MASVDVFETLLPDGVASLQYRPVRCTSPLMTKPASPTSAAFPLMTLHVSASHAASVTNYLCRHKDRARMRILEGRLAAGLIAAGLMCRRDPNPCSAWCRRGGRRVWIATTGATAVIARSTDEIDRTRSSSGRCIWSRRARAWSFSVSGAGSERSPLTNGGARLRTKRAGSTSCWFELSTHSLTPNRPSRTSFGVSTNWSESPPPEYVRRSTDHFVPTRCRSARSRFAVAAGGEVRSTADCLYDIVDVSSRRRSTPI